MQKAQQLPISKISGKPKPVVLISTPLYPPYTGGAPTYFSTLVNVLKKRVDFVIYTMQTPDKDRLEREDNVYIYRIQPYMLYSPTTLKYLVIPPKTLISLFLLWHPR